MAGKLNQMAFAPLYSLISVAIFRFSPPLKHSKNKTNSNLITHASSSSSSSNQSHKKIGLSANLSMCPVMAVCSNSTSKPIEVSKKKRKNASDSPVCVSNGGANEFQMSSSCHQCRQRTTRVVASCKNHKNSKPCAIKICQTCLLNRYGEKVEEVALVAEWLCPKCRGICNCSLCMKKKGHRPTGMLAHTAKATGFSSVSEMLLVKGSEGLSAVKAVKDIGASPERLTSSSKQMTSLTRKREKENSFDGKCDPNLETKSLKLITDEKNIEDVKRKFIKEDDSNRRITEGGKTKGNEPNKSSKKSRISEEITQKPIKKKEKVDRRDNGTIFKADSSIKPQIHGEMAMNAIPKEENISAKGESLPLVKNDSQKRVSREVSQECYKKEEKIVRTDILLQSDGVKAPSSGNLGDNKAEPKAQPEFCKVKKYTRIHSTYFDADIAFPQGTELTNVSGIDLPAEDVGHALQFLEFCKAFGQVFNLKKGQPELILRELAYQRTRRRGQYSPIVHFHIQLLSLLQKDCGEKSLPLSPTSNGNSWLQALGNQISDSCWAFEDFPSNCFDKFGDEYERLSISKKLRILNFLCDEALGTVDLRSWIDKQNLKIVERAKQAKEKVFAAKDKEKQVMQQMQDDMTRAASLSVSEYDVLISKMKNEAAKVRTEILKAIDMLPKKKQRSYAVRTESILLDGHGHIFWRLRGFSGEPSILLQDIGSWDSVTPKEKWYTYDMEHNKAVENYISSQRKKMIRMRKVREKLTFGTCEASMEHDTFDYPSSPLSVIEAES